jgi:hypothetical protein
VNRQLLRIVLIVVIAQWWVVWLVIGFTANSPF